MTKRTFRVRRLCLAITMAFAVAAAGNLVPRAEAASEVKIVVNNQAVTSYDISRRASFLRLQRSSGDLQEKARDQLVEEALKMQEAQRLGATVAAAEVEAAFERFARSNNLTKAQLTQILQRAGVGTEHFKNFIRVQMTWPRIVRARYGSQGAVDTQELVSRMLQEGGEKPSTTEYILQQIIFVVPDSKRSAILSNRRREAESMRARFTGCDRSREFAKNLKDVSVRDLGRIMQPQLPPDWKDQIESTSAGGTTGVRTTERGVEFIAVCSAQTVSDDLAAATVFQAEGQEEGASDENSQKYLAELRERATISYR